MGMSEQSTPAPHSEGGQAVSILDGLGSFYVGSDEVVALDDVREALRGKVVVDLAVMRCVLTSPDVLERTEAFARMIEAVEEHGAWNPKTQTWEEPQ